MSLTQDDLQQIRLAVEAVVAPRFDGIEGKLETLENDIKEMYEMTSELQAANRADNDFKKLSPEEKLLRVNAELQATAKQAGITLPRL